ncbi:MAG: CBS domain-containing protein [Acidobacteriota bacterium]
MKAKEVMSADLITVKPSTTVKEIAGLFSKHRIGSVPVLDDRGQLVGLVTETDLFLKKKGIPFSLVKAPTLFQQWVDADRIEEIYEQSRHHTAEDVMTRVVVCAQADQEVGDVACLMVRHGVKHIPVLQNDRLVGMITRQDLIRSLVEGQP